MLDASKACFVSRDLLKENYESVSDRDYARRAKDDVLSCLTSYATKVTKLFGIYKPLVQILFLLT